MSLATFDVFSTIKSNVTANFRRFHALAVYDSSAWFFVALFLFPCLPAEAIIDAFPHTLLVPLTKMIVDGRVIGKIMRDQLPLTARFIEIQQGIDDTPRTDC